VDKWTTCSLSHELLRKPIVVDELGNFYNKSAVIEYLLQKKTLASSTNTQPQYLLFDHLTSLKDVWECKFYENLGKDAKSSQSLSSKKKIDNGIATGEETDFAGRRLSRFVCPVTALPANGQYKFVAMRTCGCVLSEKALKEVPSENCLGCGRSLKKKQEKKAKILLLHNQPQYVDIAPGQAEEGRLRKLIANLKKSKHISKSENKQVPTQDTTSSSSSSLSSPSSSSSVLFSSSLTSSFSSSSLSLSTYSSSSGSSSSFSSSSSKPSKSSKSLEPSLASSNSLVKVKEENLKNDIKNKTPSKKRKEIDASERKSSNSKKTDQKITDPTPTSKKSKIQGYDVTQDLRWKTSAAFRSIFVPPGTIPEKPSQISTKVCSAMGQL